MEVAVSAGGLAARVAELAPFFDGLPMGVVLAEAPGGAVVYANPAVRKLIHGYRAPHGVAQYGSNATGIAADGRRLAPEEWPLARALRRGEVVHGEIVDVRRDDGQRWILSISAAPLRDERGHMIGAIALFEDQTSRREDDAFRHSLLGGISEAGLGLVVTDGRRILSVNDALAAMAGRPAKELEGLDTTLLVPEEERSEGRARQDARLSNRRPQSFRCHFARPDGTRLLVEVTGKPLSADPPRFVAIVRDLTEEERTRERMEAARRQVAQSEKLSALGSLVSGVAHEVRTPLTYLQNDLHVLARRLDRALRSGSTSDLEATRAQVDSALEAADRIRRLVEDLRRFTKLQSSARERVPLDHAVSDALLLFKATHRGQLEVVADVQATPGTIVDALELQQVVLNLLQNASEASRPGARVSVRLLDGPEAATLEVEDEGTGIAPADLPRIFDAFFTTKPEGTGLGLSIVKRIADAAGAKLAVESVPGRTRFSLRFPKGI